MDTSTRLDVEAAGHALLDRRTYGDDARVYEACELLRAREPIHYTEHPDFPPLHILTRHAHIHEVEKSSKEWGQGGYPFLTTHDEKRRQDESGYSDFRTLIHYDGEEHRAYRNVTAKWFTPAALARLNDRIDQLARQTVDRIAANGPTCDFAIEVSHFPLEVILAMLGLPEEDYPMILDLSPKATDLPKPGETYVERIASYMGYWAQLGEDLRTNPTDDLASVIANADVPGVGRMPRGDMIGYYTIFSIAGHETTSSSIAGGLHALIRNPDQLERLRIDPDPELLRSAADEMIRWVTPVKHFTRRAYEPYELDGHQFEVGDLVFVSYPAANRDPDVFADPYRFDVARSNGADHLAFGFGAHFCLGAHLARQEIRAFYAHLLPRLRSVELTGDHRTVRSNSVGGTMSLPVRIEVT